MSKVIDLVFICSIKDGLSKIVPFFSHCAIFDYLELQNKLLVNLSVSLPKKREFCF
jgi:hypothetical protein